MRRNVLIILCLVAGVAAMVAIAAFSREELRKAFLRTVMFTTADPDVLGEFSSTSMDPITVTLRVKRPELIDTDGGQHASGRRFDRSLIVTAPAAYFSEISTKKEPAGSQHIGISVWSRQFDPAQPDVIEWEQARRARSNADPAATKYQRRIEQTGEYELRFRVVNGIDARPEGRQRVLRLLAYGDQKYPCEKSFDTDLQMMTFGAPDGLQIGERWCLIGSSHNAMNYMKSNEDGSIRFTVRCAGTGPRGTPIDRSDRPHNKSLHNVSAA